jgi:hypothetical protein
MPYFRNNFSPYELIIVGERLATFSSNYTFMKFKPDRHITKPIE